MLAAHDTIGDTIDEGDECTIKGESAVSVVALVSFGSSAMVHMQTG